MTEATYEEKKIEVTYEIMINTIRFNIFFGPLTYFIFSV